MITEDSFKRRVSYLRLSVTDRCNLRCRYCMPKGKIQFFSSDELLRLEELKRLLKIFRDLGVCKVRLTGGEPLLRLELESILKEVIALGIRDVSLTTNGVTLSKRIPSLIAAGLTRINISLDTFNKERFFNITGSDSLNSVLRGIEDSIAAGLTPVKINMVVMRNINLDEVEDFVAFARNHPVEVRFLEVMPTANNFEGTSSLTHDNFVSVEEIKERVEQRAALIPEEFSGSVAKVFKIKEGIGKIGFISPISNHFCGSCNRIRLNARGILKTCLHGPDSANLRLALRQGASDQDLKVVIRNALLLKPEEHFIRPDHYLSQHLQMSQVGG